MMTLWGNVPSTNCSICGRKLTDPESVKRGIGPICRGKHGLGGNLDDDEDETSFADYALFNPLSDGIILRRDEIGVHTNVPHLVTHHSPTGFEWGYGGSGPSDLALNIVEAVLRKSGFDGPTMKCWDGNYCYEKAWALHQEFKREFTARVPREGMVIPLEVVVNWVNASLSSAG